MRYLNNTQYIKKVKEHYEAYTQDGKFICSGDTFQECSDELILLIQAEANKTLWPIAV